MVENGIDMLTVNYFVVINFKVNTIIKGSVKQRDVLKLLYLYVGEASTTGRRWSIWADE